MKRSFLDVLFSRLRNPHWSWGKQSDSTMYRSQRGGRSRPKRRGLAPWLAPNMSRMQFTSIRERWAQQDAIDAARAEKIRQMIGVK